MTAPTDWRAQRSPAWKAGYAAYNPWLSAGVVYGREVVESPECADWFSGWLRAEFDYDEARDRAREDRQHYPLSPMSAFERNRL